MGRITIKDIAADLKISPKSVSKALNGLGGVSRELRERIEKRAAELNYIPNIFGRGLNGFSMKTLGVLVSDNTNPAYALIVKGIEEAAGLFNYNIILCNTDEDVRKEFLYLQTLIERQVDGILWAPTHDHKDKSGLELVKKYNIPYIFINRNIEKTEKNCIAENYFQGGYIGTDYLLSKGHENILYLTCRNSTTAIEQRIAGYKAAMKANKKRVEARSIQRSCVVSIESGYEEMCRILKKRRDFTAVFAFNDIIAFGVLAALREHGFRVPRDIAVLGYDDIPYSRISCPPLTTIHQSFYELGNLAARRLIGRIQKNAKNDSTVLPDPYIVERETV